MQYFVLPKDRKELYNYLINKNYELVYCLKEDYLNFGYIVCVNIEDKDFTMLRSATISYQASKSDKYISVDKLKEIIERSN